MASYYYLMASLPMLKATEKPSIDFKTFISLCRSQVSEKVLTQLESEESASSPVMKRWHEFDRNLTGQINASRAQKLGLDTKFTFDRSLETDALANKVLSIANPLEAELALIEGQFDFVDSLSSMHIFDETALLCYGLKLKLLERINVFSQEKGSEEFSRLFADIQTEIGNGK